MRMSKEQNIGCRRYLTNNYLIPIGCFYQKVGIGVAI
jgi:hypothetical protein